MAISPEKRRAVIAAHDGVCFYCGTADATHVDHIVPRVCGGTDDVDNLIAACLPCNLRKHRHRLPPEAEARALDAALKAVPRIVSVSRGWGLEWLRPGKDIPPDPVGAKDHRVQFLATADQLKRLDDWAIANRIRSRGEALRRLLAAGMAQT